MQQKYTTTRSITLTLNHRRRVNSNSENRSQKRAFFPLVSTDSPWHADQQLFHVFRELSSRLLSWVHSWDPLGHSWWLQLPAAALADCSLEYHSTAAKKPQGTKGCCSQTGGFFLTAWPHVLFPTHKHGSELCFVALLFPLHLALIVILPCSIKSVGRIAQETDLPERAWKLIDGLTFKSIESQDFLC